MRQVHPRRVMRPCWDAQHGKGRRRPGWPQRGGEERPVTTPKDPFAIVRTKQYVALLILAAVLGVVISFLVYWLLKLFADIQAWVFTDLPKGLGFDGEPPWWPLLPLAVAGAVVGATIRYLPGRGGHSPAD